MNPLIYLDFLSCPLIQPKCVAPCNCAGPRYQSKKLIYQGRHIPVCSEAVNPSFIRLPVDKEDSVVDVSVHISRINWMDDLEPAEHILFWWWKTYLSKIKILYFLTAKKNSAVYLYIFVLFFYVIKTFC